MCVVLIWFDGKNLYIILIIYRLNQAGPYRLQNNQNSSLNAHDLQLDCLSSDTEEEEDVTVVKICRRRKDGNLLKRLPDCPTDQNPNPNLELCDDIDPSRLLLEHAGADQASRELNGTVTDSQEIKVDNTRKRKSSEILSEIQQENQRLKEARTCKICMDNKIEVALYPCGHLVSCVNCSFHLIDCPVCRKFIKRIVRTYMSWNFFHKYF